MSNSNVESTREALFTIRNALTKATASQVRILVSEDCIPALCYVLKTYDEPALVSTCMDALIDILRVGMSGGGFTVYGSLVSTYGGLVRAEKLMSMSDSVIAAKASKLVRWISDCN
jgi:hypothetical protein